jgi:group I intron endonuclease
MPVGIIYAVRNKVSGKRYIGQTTATTASRWRQHIKAARRGSKSPFHCALRAYGPDAWEIDTLYETDGPPSELDALEQLAIREWRVQDRAFGYNILDGGNASPAKLPEVRAKIAATLTGRKRSPESIARQVASHAGFRHSEETKAKIGAGNRIAKSTTSDETRQRMRAAALKRPLPDAFKPGHPAWNTRRKS